MLPPLFTYSVNRTMNSRLEKNALRNGDKDSLIIYLNT